MVALAADPTNRAAEAVVNRDRHLHSLLRTTCVATLIQGGHALNALPQRVTANVNCRIIPGHPSEEIAATLTTVVGDKRIGIELREKDKPSASVPPLDPAVIGPMERLSARYFPGVPVIGAMATGASDAVYTGAVGIPTYGVPGIWADPDGDGIHGLNEKIEVGALMKGRDYLHDLVVEYTR